MTCVVGVIDYCKKNVVIGADDGSVQGSLRRLRKDPKVFRLSKYIVAAFTGSFRMGQILRFSSEPQKDIISSIPNSEIEKFVVLTIIPKLIVNFDNNRCLRKESAQWKMPGEIMLGIKDQLFVIGQDFQVARYQEPFTAHLHCQE